MWNGTNAKRSPSSRRAWIEICSAIGDAPAQNVALLADLIALNVYGSELKADWLMQNNPRYIHIVRFDSGTVLSTPALPAEKSGDLPPWKAGA